MILMFMPTRGRPVRAHQAVLTAKANGDSSHYITAVLDGKDEMWSQYMEEISNDCFVITGFGNMVQRTNWAVIDLRPSEEYDGNVVGWMADDTFFRTKGWDRRVLDAFNDRKTLMVSVDDGHLGEKRPQSAIFMRKDAMHALGWLCLPVVNHLYVDNAWKDLMERLGEHAKYLPDVLGEHMHPYIQKGEWDDQYLSLHEQARYDEDKPRYEEWRAKRLEDDVRRMMTCLQ